MYHVPCQFADKTYRSAVWNIHWWTLRALLLHWTPKKSTHEATTSKNQQKKMDHQKNLPFFKTEVFQMIFYFGPPQRARSPRRSPLCVFGGWTGVFHSAGCQWSDIDSLLAPRLISFFLVLTSMRNVAKKRQKAAVSIFWGGDFKIVIFQGTGNGRTLLLVVDDAHFKKESMESLAMPRIHVLFLKKEEFCTPVVVYVLYFYIYFFF